MGVGDWTDDQIDTLTNHWSTKSASDIGAMVNKTRNAVIGKAARLGLPHKKPVRTDLPIRVRKEPKTTRTKWKTVSPRKRMEDGKLPPIPVVVPQPVNGGLHIMELKAHHCRSVIGRGPEGLARYCGVDRRDENTSWCPAHAALYLTSS